MGANITQEVESQFSGQSLANVAVPEVIGKAMAISRFTRTMAYLR